jgi:hypothetical protein
MSIYNCNNYLYGICEQNYKYTNKFYNIDKFKYIIAEMIAANVPNFTIIVINMPNYNYVIHNNDYYIVDNYTVIDYFSINNFLIHHQNLSLELVKNNSELFQFLPEKLRHSSQIAQIALQKSYKNYAYIGDELQKNKIFADIALSDAIGCDEYIAFAQLLHNDLSHDYDFCKLILGKIYNFARG